MHNTPNNNELLKNKLIDITVRYCKTLDNINSLKTKIKDKDSLNLLDEVDKNTIAIHDLYGTVLKLMLDSHQTISDMLAEIIENMNKQEQQK